MEAGKRKWNTANGSHTPRRAPGRSRVTALKTGVEHFAYWYNAPVYARGSQHGYFASRNVAATDVSTGASVATPRRSIHRSRARSGPYVRATAFARMARGSI